MKEREFQAWVIEVAERFGWRVWHVPAPMRPIPGGRMVPEKRARGLPDLIMLHEDPPRLIFAEIKDEDGKLSDDQREFLRLARSVADAAITATPSSSPVAAGVARAIGVYTWRPGVEDLIEAVLRGKVMIP